MDDGKIYDLFSRIEMYQENIQKNLDSMNDFSFGLTALIGNLNSNIVKNFGKNADKSKSSSGLEKKIDGLVVSIDKLSKNVEPKEFKNQKTTKIDTKSLGEIGKNVFGFAKDISLSLPFYSIIKGRMTGIAGVINKFIIELGKDITPENEKTFEGVGKIMSGFSSLITTITTDLKKVSIGDLVMTKFIKMKILVSTVKSTIKALSGSLTSEDAIRAKLVGESLTEISSGIRSFSVAMAVSTPLLLIGAIGAGIFAGMLPLMISSISNIHKSKINSTEAKSSSLSAISSDVRTFATNMALTTPLMLIALPGIALLALMVKPVVWVANLLADNSSNIAKSSFAITAMGISMALLAGGLVASALMLRVLDPKTDIINLGLMALSMGALAFVYTAIGRYTPLVIFGAIGVVAIAGSMALYAWAISYASKSYDKNTANSILIFGASILALGTAYATLGAITIAPIAIGAAAVAIIAASIYVVGESLSALGKGISSIGSITIADDFGKNLSNFISGYAKVIMSSSIVDVASITAASPAIMAIGESLQSIGKGIEIASRVKVDQSKIQALTASVKLVLDSLKKTYAEIGLGERATSKHTWFWATGDTEIGADVAFKMFGPIMAINQLLSGNTLVIKKERLRQVLTGVLTTIFSLQGVYAELGASERKSRIMVGTLGDKGLGANLVESMAKSVSMITGTFSAYKDTKSNGKLGALIGKDIREMAVEISTGFEKITPASVNKLREMVDPIQNVVAAMKELNDVFKDHFLFIAKLDTKFVNNFAKWSTALKDISTVQSVNVKKSVKETESYSKLDIKEQTSSTPRKSSPTPVPAQTAPVQSQNESKLEKLLIQQQADTKLMMESMMKMMNLFMESGSKNNLELTAIKNVLLSGIKIKESLI